MRIFKKEYIQIENYKLTKGGERNACNEEPA